MCSEEHASVCRKHFLGPCVDAATQRCNTAAYHCQRREMARRVWDFGCDVGGPNAFRQPWRCQCLNNFKYMHQYRRIVFILKRTKGNQTLSKPWLFSIYFNFNIFLRLHAFQKWCCKWRAVPKNSLSGDKAYKAYISWPEIAPVAKPPVLPILQPWCRCKSLDASRGQSELFQRWTVL